VNISIAEQIKLPGIVDVQFSGDTMSVHLTDGRILMIPLAWYPRLYGATRKQLENFEISPSGYGIHWPDIDEDLSVLGFLLPGQK
jgi:hypothetical protein